MTYTTTKQNVMV